ncbi:MAG: ABC transporter substrate-binding protein [Acidimicrobiales bacterium]
MRRILALLLALAMIAAACGGDDDDSTAGEDEGTDTDSSETTEAEGDDETEVTVQSVDEDEGQELAGQTVTAEPLGDRGPEPSGTLDFSWHTAFSPRWFDPAINTSSVSQFATQYILHDALVKGIPGQTFAPSLAEEYTIADDFTWAEFRLREGLTFHDGSPLTTEDVAFSYENYSGANSGPLQDNLDNIEIVDDLNIRFNFTGPFLDFLVLYGTTASGAGWILPSDYYQEVGPDDFLLAPIGAGPFRFVENQDNTTIVYEANTDYWKKNPGVETLNFLSITDPATRVSALQTGEVDLINVIPGDLLDAVRDDENLTLQPTTAVPFWIEFVGYDDPESPFNDVRVREAVAIALNRDQINEAETGGGGETVGQWIPKDWPGALAAEPIEYDIERAKELMAEAGYADGFEVDQLTPLPNYFSLGERIITSLAEIGITTSLNQMDRGAFLGDINAGKEGTLTGILVNISGAGGGASARVANFATCDGSASRICDEFIDERYGAFVDATDADERQKILDEIQQYIIDEHIFVYAYTLGLNMGQGPDVVQPADEVWAQIPQYVYPGLWEDITVQG